MAFAARITRKVYFASKDRLIPQDLVPPVFHRHSNKHQINREYVRQVTFTDAPTLDEAIEELEDVGLLSCTGEVLSLDDAPDVRCQSDTMEHYFEDPTGRQELLRRLYKHATAPL